jgi:tetratricopeptide (TPR) repeat protein
VNNRLESLINLLKKDPDDSFLLYGIALEYLSVKKFDEAEKYFENLLAKDPKYVPAYMQYARLKEKQNQTNEAKILYRKGIEIARETGDAHAAKEMEEFLDELE